MQNGRPLPTAPTRNATTTPTNGAAANGVHAPAPAAAPVGRLPHHEVIKVAARASVDPKTVRRYLKGGRCHATTAHRIAIGLAKCGLEQYVRRVAI